jgi:hypothetical protein
MSTTDSLQRTDVGAVVDLSVVFAKLDGPMTDLLETSSPDDAEIVHFSITVDRSGVDAVSELLRTNEGDVLAVTPWTSETSVIHTTLAWKHWRDIALASEVRELGLVQWYSMENESAFQG